MKKLLISQKNRVNLIYAPNGTMKTSLANTFFRLSKGEKPEERIFNKSLCTATLAFRGY